MCDNSLFILDHTISITSYSFILQVYSTDESLKERNRSWIAPNRLKDLILDLVWAL